MSRVVFDFVFENHGSVWICEAQNDGAFSHLTDRLSNETQYWGRRGIAVEPRYVPQLAQALCDDGWSVAVAP